jgi:hypothetical protein
VRIGTGANAVVQSREGDALLANWRLRYSWPFRHSLALSGKYEQNLRKKGPLVVEVAEAPRVQTG